MGNLFFNEYPYTDFHEMNLTWLIKKLNELNNMVNDFVAINAIKYADPIQWDIVRQYERNTVVIDPLTGTAYISVKPVPSGVALTNTDYWTVVFDLGSFVTKASKNLTSKYEESTTLTATFNSNVNDWLVWGDVLYRVISPIVAGDQYVVGSNIVHFTIEQTTGHLQNLTTQTKTNLVLAINECVNGINDTLSKIGDLSQLTTQTKTSVVLAINECVGGINGALSKIGDLTQLATQTKTNIVASINEIVNEITTSLIPAINTIRDDVGDKTQLQTTDKSNLVNAINELVATSGDDTFNQSHQISTAIFFGDSITAGDLGTGVIANPTFPQSYGRIAGVTTTNMGRGGSTAANNPNAGSAEHLNYVASLVNFANYDQCFVCHGVNDYNANSPLGAINSTDDTTFMGALQKFIERAYSQNPKIQIIILGTFWSSHAHVVNNQFVGSLPANAANCTIADYINGARSVANRYNLPFIDLMDMMGVNFKNYGSWTLDGIHPTQESYTKIGVLIAKSLSFPAPYGYEEQIAVHKTLNNNLLCIGDFATKVGDFPERYMKRGLTNMWNANNAYQLFNRHPYTVVAGEPITFHAIAHVSAGANFYIRLTQSGTSNTCVLWAYQNTTNADKVFEVNETVCPTFTADTVVESQIAALDGTLDTEIVYLTDMVINKGEIPDRGGLGAYYNEYTWIAPSTIASGVTNASGNPVEFIKDRNGCVQFRGRFNISTTLATATIATIAPQFAPQRTISIPVVKVSSTDCVYISITAAGDVIYSERQSGAIAVNHIIDLSNITYNIMQTDATTSPY